MLSHPDMERRVIADFERSVGRLFPHLSATCQDVIVALVGAHFSCRLTDGAITLS